MRHNFVAICLFILFVFADFLFPCCFWEIRGNHKRFLSPPRVLPPSIFLLRLGSALPPRNGNLFCVLFCLLYSNPRRAIPLPDAPDPPGSQSARQPLARGYARRYLRPPTLWCLAAPPFPLAQPQFPWAPIRRTGSPVCALGLPAGLGAHRPPIPPPSSWRVLLATPRIVDIVADASSRRKRIY